MRWGTDTIRIKKSACSPRSGDLKEKGFQLKAIKMILSTLSEDMPASNIISLDKVRKNYADETFLEGEAAPAGGHIF